MDCDHGRVRACRTPCATQKYAGAGCSQWGTMDESQGLAHILKHIWGPSLPPQQVPTGRRRRSIHLPKKPGDTCHIDRPAAHQDHEGGKARSSPGGEVPRGAKQSQGCHLTAEGRETWGGVEELCGFGVHAEDLSGCSQESGMSTGSWYVKREPRRAIVGSTRGTIWSTPPGTKDAQASSDSGKLPPPVRTPHSALDAQGV